VSPPAARGHRGPATGGDQPARARGGRTRATLGSRPGATLGERGGATLVGLALAGLVLMVGVVGVDVGALAGARAAAQTAADMAALAALTPQVGEEGRVAWSAEDWGEARAAELAGANGAELVRCDCSSVQAVVTVRRWLRLVPGGVRVSVGASSRAMLGRPPPASRATVQAVDLLRAVDGDLAKRPGGANEGEAVGRRAGQRELAVYVNLNPIVAALLGVLLLGERRSALFLLGFVAVVAGVLLVNWPGDRT
jgi:hypothetical protein